MIHSYLFSFWRITILLTAVTASIFYNQAPKAASLNNGLETIKTMPTLRQQGCFETGHSCSVPALFSVTKTQTKPSHVQVAQASQHYLCHNDESANTTYGQALTAALNTTNSKVDDVRQVAANNGESYQAFDTQTNNLFSAYNNEVQQAYNIYTNSLRGCRTSYAPPILFQMFSP